MRVDVITIGNSRGIRIPKALLEQCGIKMAVDLQVKDHALVMTPYRQEVRAGWEESFKRMAKSDDDVLLDEDISNIWDEEEWQW